MLKIYTLATCETCRRAVKWLRAHQISFDERAIREQPPSAAELRTVCNVLRYKGGLDEVREGADGAGIILVTIAGVRGFSA